MKKKRTITKLHLIILSILLSSCGLYQSPQAPEFFAPLEINDLVVTPSVDSIEIKWSASTKDRRRENLKFIDGYLVERKGPIQDSERNTEFKYKKLKFIPDQHISIEKDLKELAIQKGEISRKVKADPMYYNFSLIDQDLEPKSLYFYKITPINQGNVEGVVKQIVAVEFDGETSKVILVEPESEEAP